MSGFGSFRRRNNQPPWNGSANGDAKRDGYSHPERDDVMSHIERHMRSLAGAIDEGTGASLDHLIESWAGAWIARVRTEYVDHCRDISAHRGRARQRLAEASIAVDYEREQLDHIRADYFASRQRLTGEYPDLAQSAALIGATSPQHGDGGALRGPAPRSEWTAPHLVAGRSQAGLVLGALLILVGAMADTIAFHNVLELVLRTESETVAWVMAVGTTSMALVSAGILGVNRAIRRRQRHLAPRHRPPRLPLIVSAVVWLGLGLAMFVIRWKANTGIGVLNFTQSSTTSSTNSNSLWQAVFFAAIYLISGVCTMFEAERLYNPDYSAFRRLRKQYAEQAKRLSKAEAERERAEAALELHDGELEREDHRRAAALADRQALGAEAANYARVLMAGMMGDPAKTPVTETGPVPDMSASFTWGSPGASGGTGGIGAPGGQPAGGSGGP